MCCSSLPAFACDPHLISPTPLAGESLYQFTQMIRPEDIDSVRKIDEPGSTVSGLALNDDIEGSEAEQERSVLAIKCVLLHSLLAASPALTFLSLFPQDIPARAMARPWLVRAADVAASTRRPSAKTSRLPRGKPAATSALVAPRPSSPPFCLYATRSAQSGLADRRQF